MTYAKSIFIYIIVSPFMSTMYADIKQMGTLKDKSAAAKFNKNRKNSNGLPAMDYEAVNQTKWEYFRLIFKQEGEKY